MRREWTAAAAGLVVVMSLVGCGAAAPEGDALYRDGEKRFLEMATRMHTVLMGIHEGPWTVDEYGAIPHGCSIGFGGPGGFAFGYRRSVDLSDMDPDAVSAAAVVAFREAGFEASPVTYGSGDAAEWNVLAEDEGLGNVVATIRPKEGRVIVSVDTSCAPGNAGDLSYMVKDAANRGADPSTWRFFPATEGPDSVPQFYFPADGPIYFNEDGTLVEPQPVVTDPPKAPYDG